MRHYDAVMPWVGLFLFGRGLATFAGPHINRALLFPMQDVFEDFVTAAVRRHQRRFTVHAQGPMRPLATDRAGKDAFRLKPDVVLSDSTQVRYILDAKWKRLDLRRCRFTSRSSSDSWMISIWRWPAFRSTWPIQREPFA